MFTYRFAAALLAAMLIAPASAWSQSHEQDSQEVQTNGADQSTNNSPDHPESSSDDEPLEQHDEDESDGRAAFEEMFSQSGASSQGNEGDICGVILCMAGSSSSVAPHECKPYVKKYFEVRVYKHRRFKPVQTAIKRYKEVLMACPDASPGERDRINAMFGTLEFSPFVFN